MHISGHRLNLFRSNRVPTKKSSLVSLITIQLIGISEKPRVKSIGI